MGDPEVGALALSNADVAYISRHPHALIQATRPRAAHQKDYHVPSAIALSASTIVHTAAVGTNVGNVTVTQVPPPNAPASIDDTFTYTIVGGNAGGFFNMSGNILQVAQSPIPVGTINVVIRVKGIHTGVTFTQTFPITVT